MKSHTPEIIIFDKKRYKIMPYLGGENGWCTNCCFRYTSCYKVAKHNCFDNNIYFVEVGEEEPKPVNKYRRIRL